MQIRLEQHDELLELHVSGRLDAEWAPTLTAAIDGAIRDGFHALLINLAEVTYVSSAGLSVLVRAQQQFAEIRGFFGAGGAQGFVAEVIRLSGMAKLLLCDLETARGSGGSIRSTIQVKTRYAGHENIGFEIYPAESKLGTTCTLIGDPRRFASGTYSEADSVEVPFPVGTSGIGLGAFGDSFADCASRFGELIAVSGAVAQTPSGGNRVPDFQRIKDQFVPKARLISGLTWPGDTAQFVRFETETEGGQIGLSRLMPQLLSLLETQVAAVVMIAETTGLVGASLRRSPVEAAQSGSRFQHPEIRDWLEFTPERAWPHSLALIAGIVARSSNNANFAPLIPFLRPLGEGIESLGHFHAAVFPFRPFKKRRLVLGETVQTLFDSEQLQAVMHLLNDDRAISGAGDSEFVRGACWVSAINGVREVAR